MFEAVNVYINSSSFSSNAGKAFTQLWGAEDFFDVTLASGERKQIKAHKNVLSSSSNFFRQVLTRIEGMLTQTLSFISKTCFMNSWSLC